LSPEQVSAVIVTKGDVDMGPIVHSLPFDDIVVWDNSERENLKVYGRYAAIKEAKHPIIYTQDDDCWVDAVSLIEAYEPGSVVCNMPVAKREEYRTLAPKVGLVGWGACFDKGLTDVLDRYIDKFGQDDLCLRECDRVFTQLNTLKFVDVKFLNTPSAYFSNRMGSQAGHLRALSEVTKRVSSLTQ